MSMQHPIRPTTHALSTWSSSMLEQATKLVFTALGLLPHAAVHSLSPAAVYLCATTGAMSLPHCRLHALDFNSALKTTMVRLCRDLSLPQGGLKSQVEVRLHAHLASLPPTSNPTGHFDHDCYIEPCATLSTLSGLAGLPKPCLAPRLPPPPKPCLGGAPCLPRRSTLGAPPSHPPTGPPNPPPAEPCSPHLHHWPVLEDPHSRRPSRYHRPWSAGPCPSHRRPLRCTSLEPPPHCPQSSLVSRPTCN